MRILQDSESGVVSVCFGSEFCLLVTYDEEDGLCIEDLEDQVGLSIEERKLRFTIEGLDETP